MFTMGIERRVGASLVPVPGQVAGILRTEERKRRLNEKTAGDGQARTQGIAADYRRSPHALREGRRGEGT